MIGGEEKGNEIKQLDDCGAYVHLMGYNRTIPQKRKKRWCASVKSNILHTVSFEDKTYHSSPTTKSTVALKNTFHVYWLPELNGAGVNVRKGTVPGASSLPRVYNIHVEIGTRWNTCWYTWPSWPAWSYYFCALSSHDRRCTTRCNIAAVYTVQEIVKSSMKPSTYKTK